jgi:hypothetical protein
MVPTIAVDVDGVLAEYDGWQGIENIGNPFPGAQKFVAELRQYGRVLIFSTRCNPEVNEEARMSVDRLREVLQEWLDDNEFMYDDIYTGIGKPLAAVYIDDRAVLCNPMINGRGYEDALSDAVGMLRNETPEPESQEEDDVGGLTDEQG